MPSSTLKETALSFVRGEFLSDGEGNVAEAAVEEKHAGTQSRAHQLLREKREAPFGCWGVPDGGAHTSIEM